MSIFGIYKEKLGHFGGELSGYEDLAWNIDRATTAYYLRTENREIITGSRILVRKGGGREERAIFLNKIDVESLNFINLTSNFFKLAVEELKKKGYTALKCWEEGDLDQLMKIEDNSNDNLHKVVVGMVVSGEKAIIKSSNPVKGVILIAKVIQELKPVLNLDFNSEVSKMHSNFDVSITPKPVEYDIDLDKRLAPKEIEFLDFYDAYKNISEDNFENRKELKEKLGEINWSRELKRTLKQKKSVISFYEEKPESFLKEIAYMRDSKYVCSIINEIGLHALYIHFEISDEVAVSIIKKSIDRVDENGEKFLEKLYDGLDRKKRIFTDLLDHIVDKIEDRRSNFKKKILKDVIKCENKEIFIKVVNRNPLSVAEATDLDDAVDIIKRNLYYTHPII